MEISLGDKETFKLTGDVVLSKGWTVFEEREKKDKVLPNLQVGEVVNIDFKKVEKETRQKRQRSLQIVEIRAHQSHRNRLLQRRQVQPKHQLLQRPQR